MAEIRRLLVEQLNNAKGEFFCNEPLVDIDACEHFMLSYLLVAFCSIFSTFRRMLICNIDIVFKFVIVQYYLTDTCAFVILYLKACLYS